MARVVARMRLIGSALVAWCTTLGVCSSARAQAADTAAAEALFEEGRDLLRAGRAAEACPKLAESQQLDPATGTLLALAMCHKAEGKLASAWSEFVDVAARARRENRPDREQVAADESKALRPQLSTLVITVPAELATAPGLAIRRDGVSLGSGAWNTPVPVDGGDHVVEVTAVGKTPWKRSVSIKLDSDAAVVVIPVLADAPVPIPSSNTGAPSSGIDATASKRWGPLEWTGVSVAGAGVVAFGIGGYFLASALGKKSDSSKNCNGDSCGPQGFSDRTAAVSKGNTATILGIAGGALVASGAVLFIVGRTQGQRSEGPSLGLAFGAGPTGADAHFSGRF